MACQSEYMLPFPTTKPILKQIDFIVVVFYGYIVRDSDIAKYVDAGSFYAYTTERVKMQACTF